jgi:hypothetical protein
MRRDHLPDSGTYEVDVARATYHFHMGCYGLWMGQLILRGLYRLK